MANGLSVDITGYSLPNYWTADSGKVSLNVNASGDSVVGKPGYINLYLSTDGTLDGRSEYLVSSQYIDSFDKSKSYDLDFNQYTTGDASDPRDLALAPGRYYLVAHAVGGNDGFVFGTEKTFASEDVLAVSAPNTDVLIDWISTYMTSSQLEGVSSDFGDAPYNGLRHLAMVSSAAYDIAAANPSEGRGLYNISTELYNSRPSNLSLEAAINKAAHVILSNVFPSQSNLYDEQYELSKSELNLSRLDLTASEAYGDKVAEQMLISRSNDGTTNETPFDWPASDNSFTWLPQPYNGNGKVGGPNRGNIDPFVFSSLDQLHSYSATQNQDKLLIKGKDGDIDLRLNYRPTDGDGTRYKREYETARVYGVLNDTPYTQKAWDADQREIGEWYSQDEADSWQPWGLPNYMAMAIAVHEGNSLTENAQLFATLHTAIADATTAAWHDKFTNVIPRPKQVISGYANQTMDENGVAFDPLWKSQLEAITPGVSSPAFPDYVSGHSDIYGAWSAVMEAYFGTDYKFSAGSQTLEGTKRTFDGYTDPVSGIQWSAFKEAAMEAAQSRLFWGVHTPSATGSSFLTGQNIGHYAMQQQIFGKPLINSDFDGIPDWTPFAANFTANPILPYLQLGDPILSAPYGIGTSDGATGASS